MKAQGLFVFKILDPKYQPKLNFVIGLSTWQKKYTLPNTNSIEYFKYGAVFSLEYYGFVNV